MRTTLALLALTAALVAQPNYPDFTAAPGLTLNGNAALNAGVLVLNPSATGQNSSAFDQVPVSVVAGFDMVFTFRMALPICGGADGMTFVVHADPRLDAALGVNGGQMGYGDDLMTVPNVAFQNALVIELDTWFNGNDLSSNEISIHTNGSGSVNNDENFSIGRVDPGINMSDGQVHTMRVRYVPGTLEVFLDDLSNPVLSVAYDFIGGGTHILPGTPVGGLNLLGGVAAFVGFTAATGGCAESHEVLSWVSAPFGWQTNGTGISLDVDGDLSDGFTGPARTVGCTGQLHTISLGSPNVGQPFDAGIQLSPLVANGFVTPGGQILNLDFASLIWVNSTGVLPTFTTPFPGNFSVNYVAPATPALLALQAVILDPTNPDGLALSQGSEVDTQLGGSIAGPTGDDSSLNVPLDGPPLCAPGGVSIFGTVYTSIDVNSNGRVTFGGGDTDFSATVAEALTDLPQIGAWNDFNPGGAQLIGISNDAATGEIVVDYGTAAAPLPYFGSASPAGFFQVRINPAFGDLTLTNLQSLGDHTANTFLGISGGSLVGATDPGAVAYSTTAGVSLTPTDMIYEFGTPGPNGTLSVALAGINTILYTPNALGNYDWVAF